jgi:serine/threonine protein kinase
VLGQGAFGRVYRAEDTGDPQRPLRAVKELLDYQFTTPEEKEEAVRWFKREVGTLLQLSHPSIPAIHAYWTADAAAGPFYLAMDYIHGQTLEETMDTRGGRISWQEATTWAIYLCNVLAYLHGQLPPYVFRDLKPPNIMIDAGLDRPKLIDFGIAKQVAGRANHTAIGTWGYVPMEQLLGQAEPRSDIYALGATLHSMLTGHRPEERFRQLQAGGYDVPQALRTMFQRVDHVVPDIPAELADAVERATAFDAADRFPDAQSMGLALARSLGMNAAAAVRVMQP